MSGERPRHSVLLRSPELFDPAAVAAVLAKRRGAPAESLLPTVRRAWGLAGAGLPAEEAEALAAELSAAGQAATAVPDALIEPLPPARPLAKAALSPEGLDAEAPERERLPWTRLRALCAGRVETRATKTVTEGPDPSARAVRLGLMLVTGLPLPGGKKTTRQVSEVRDEDTLELVFLDPVRRLRVRAEEFDYSVLGAEMTYSAELNFRALVRRLGAQAPRALRSRGTRAIIDKKPSGELVYDSLEDLEREELWLAALAALSIVK